MRYLVKGPEHILWCGLCFIPLQMTEHRELRCPNCRRSTLDEPQHVMHCAECKHPLQVTNHLRGFGNYCPHCKFHPSLQDIFLMKISAMKPTRT